MLKTFNLSMFRHYLAAFIAVAVLNILPPVANAQDPATAGGGV